MESMHNLLGSTREEHGLGGAREDCESWRQEGRTPRTDPRSKGRGVQRPGVFGGSEHMRSDGRTGWITIGLECHAKSRLDQSCLKDKASNRRYFAGTMGSGLEDNRFKSLGMRHVL